MLISAAAADLVKRSGIRLRAAAEADASDEVLEAILRETYEKQDKPWIPEDLTLARIVVTELGPRAAVNRCLREFPPDMAAEAFDSYTRACYVAGEYLDPEPYKLMIHGRVRSFDFGRFIGMVDAFMVHSSGVVQHEPTEESLASARKVVEQVFEEERLRAEMGFEPEDFV